MNLGRVNYIFRLLIPALLILILFSALILYPDFFGGNRTRTAVGAIVIILNLLFVIFRYVRKLEIRRENMEHIYKQTARKHRVYMDTTADGIILLGDDGTLRADETILRLTGYAEEEIAGLRLEHIISRENDGDELFFYLEHIGEDIDGLYDIRMKDKSGGKHEVILSVSRIESEGMKGLIFMVKDVGGERRSTALKLSLAMEGQLLELQTGMLFMNRPVGELGMPPLLGSAGLTVREAALLMAENQMNSLIVTVPGKGYGIITDQDLRDRILLPERKRSTLVEEVMSFPLITLPEEILFFEAFHKMRDHHIRQVGIVNKGGELTGIITEKMLMNLSGHSPYPILGELEKARDVNTLADIYGRLPASLMTLVKLGADAQQISRMASMTAHAIGVKIIDLILKDMDPPPCKFAVLALGSEGRGEQTLLTDQDNGIIFADINTPDREAVRTYFMRLGARMNDELNRVGYNLCKGGVMAGHPKWCRSLTEWKDAYSDWVHPGQSKKSKVSLLEANILADFDLLYGDRQLALGLRNYISSLKDDSRGFFLMMAERAPQFFTPPLTITGKIKTSLTDAEERVFNIKKALSPLVIYARLLSMKKGISATNTFERLKVLRDNGELSEETYREIRHAYDYLLRLRFKNQIECLEENEPMDNDIYMKDLIKVEEKTLIQIFQMIQSLQTSIKIYFTGRIR